MKIFTILSLLLIFTFQQLSALEVPSYDGYVTDLAGVLSANEKEALEKRLEIYEESTSNQIAILIIDSLEGEILENYSINVARKWGIGQKDKDNGILILISLGDRKMRVEVGRGLEGTMTDLLSSRVIEKMRPHFKNENYYEGINDGIDLIYQIISGEYTNEDAEAEKENTSKITLFSFLAIVAVIITVIISSINPILGAIIGAIIGFFTGSFFFGIIGGIICSIIGFVLGLVIGIIAESGGSSGGYGGGFSGGSFGSSSSSSGFSFGGGGFGGGGASGGW